MKRRIVRFWWIGLLTLTIGLVAVGGYIWLINSLPREEWIEANQSFKLRVLRMQTVAVNYRYDFQVSDGNSEKWRDVYSHVQDDPTPVSSRQVRIVSNSIGYLTIGTVYAVTTDAGETWTFFDIKRNSEFGGNYPMCGWIKDVKIATDGKGEIVLRGCHQVRNLPTFRTDDFGLSWAEQYPLSINN